MNFPERRQNSLGQVSGIVSLLSEEAGPKPLYFTGKPGVDLFLKRSMNVSVSHKHWSLPLPLVMAACTTWVCTITVWNCAGEFSQCRREP